ncbi:MAG: aminopeptidase P family protein [Rhodospirillales bacterium]
MPSQEPTRGFAQAEFETRLAKAQGLMAGRELDAVLLTTEPEIRYFSGFQTLFWQSPTRPWFLLVPREGEPVAVIPEIGAALMRQTWINDIRTWSAPAPADDGISLLSDLLSPYARSGRTLGLLKGHETSLRMPLGDYERLLAGLPGLRVRDATDLVRSLRMVKSDAEIEKIAHICAIASRSFGRMDRLIHHGQPLVAAFKAFKIDCLANGADDVPYLVGGADQGGYIDVISPPSNRPLRDGDIVMMDTGAVFDGYFCDFDRNYAIGVADDASKRAYDVAYRATEAGLAAARPGVTCAQLFRAMHAVIAEVDAGSGDVGRMGHGLGMQLTEWPSHAAFDDTPLRENMVITLEPSLSYGDGRIMVHEENIVVRDGPPTLLTRRAPPALPVIG